jgi:hypothetical protein
LCPSKLPSPGIQFEKMAKSKKKELHSVRFINTILLHNT